MKQSLVRSELNLEQNGLTDQDKLPEKKYVFYLQIMHFKICFHRVQVALCIFYPFRVADNLFLPLILFSVFRSSNASYRSDLVVMKCFDRQRGNSCFLKVSIWRKELQLIVRDNEKNIDNTVFCLRSQTV